MRRGGKGGGEKSVACPTQTPCIPQLLFPTLPDLPTQLPPLPTFFSGSGPSSSLLGPLQPWASTPVYPTPHHPSPLFPSLVSFGLVPAVSVPVPAWGTEHSLSPAL